MLIGSTVTIPEYDIIQHGIGEIQNRVMSEMANDLAQQIARLVHKEMHREQDPSYDDPFAQNVTFSIRLDIQGRNSEEEEHAKQRRAMEQMVSQRTYAPDGTYRTHSPYITTTDVHLNNSAEQRSREAINQATSMHLDKEMMRILRGEE